MDKDNKKTVIIIRGGSVDTMRSMKNGANVILALSKYPELVRVIDVSLDERDNWFERGIPSDPHKVFSKADFYIDFTNNKSSDYHQLSKRLNVTPVFEEDYISTLNRVNIKRILAQLNISFPKYIVIRNNKNLAQELKTAWIKLSTPIVVKEVKHSFNEKSLLTHSFLESYNLAKKILDKGGEVMLEEHIKGKYISVVVMPNYRDKKFYIATPVEMIGIDILKKDLKSTVLQERCLIGHNCEKIGFVFAEEALKKEIKKLAESIHSSLFLEHYSMIDLALVQNQKTGKHILKVLDIHTHPSIFEDSRFDFILKNSGVDLGQFIVEKVQKNKVDYF